MTPDLATRIFLVRHGGTIWSADDRFAGSSDIELSADGRAQAAALGKRLARENISAVYSSDMKRTLETAKLAIGDRPLKPVACARLREISHGHWEGRTHKEVEAAFGAEYSAWDADPFNAAPPGGESGLSVLARALPALLEIVSAHRGQTVLVVSHKATNRLLLSSLLGVDPRYYRERLMQDFACLNVLEFQDYTRARLMRMNDISHYETGLGI